MSTKNNNQDQIKKIKRITGYELHKLDKDIRRYNRRMGTMTRNYHDLIDPIQKKYEQAVDKKLKLEEKLKNKIQKICKHEDVGPSGQYNPDGEIGVCKICGAEIDDD